jgi:hypothetical protein
MELKVRQAPDDAADDSIRKFATGVINDEKSLATLAELLIRDHKTRHFAFPRSLSHVQAALYLFCTRLNNPVKFNFPLCA